MSFAHGLRPEFRFPNGLLTYIIRDYIMRMLYKNCYLPTVIPCCGTAITHCAYVVCYFRDVYHFRPIYFIIAMYVLRLDLYCILLWIFLISKLCS